jgi:hypothetical protein
LNRHLTDRVRCTVRYPNTDVRISSALGEVSVTVEHLTSQDTQIRDELLARLSPAGHDHINFYGRYDFTNPTRPPHGQLRPLRAS